MSAALELQNGASRERDLGEGNPNQNTHSPIKLRRTPMARGSTHPPAAPPERAAHSTRRFGYGVWPQTRATAHCARWTTYLTNMPENKLIVIGARTVGHCPHHVRSSAAARPPGTARAAYRAWQSSVAEDSATGAPVGEPVGLPPSAAPLSTLLSRANRTMSRPGPTKSSSPSSRLCRLLGMALEQRGEACTTPSRQCSHHNGDKAGTTKDSNCSPIAWHGAVVLEPPLRAGSKL